MDNIKELIFEIYKIISPKLNLKIEYHSKMGFLHFEKYDYLLEWNKPTSIIDIYLPLKKSSKYEQL